MPQWILGVIAALGPPIFHGLSNILDNHLANNIVNRLAPLIFISSVTGIVLLPVIFYLDAPQMLSGHLLGIAFGIALIEIGYLYPYYWALKDADTSIVSALFSLGRLFVPILAFFLIGERLSALQYGGLGVIILSSVFLTFDIRHFRFNRAFFLMLFVTAILAMQAVMFKYLFDQGASWGTGVAWVYVFEFLIALGVALIPSNFRELSGVVRKINSYKGPFLLNEVLGWMGNLTSYYAVFLIPVSVAKAIGSTQPLFVLLFAYLISKWNKEVLHEHVGRDGIHRKGVLFAGMIAGACLTIFG